MYYIYVLQSLTRRRFYIGVTKNLADRLHKHNSGSSKSTKPYRPWVVIYTEEYYTKESAYKREWHLKHPAGLLEKQMIIKQHHLK